ncbi:FAD/NAD(P)-binding domain-containing protein [Phialemonium atrogriseum]|uniref:FAD/NAD(P)-binding domain-containing protein n=1 Tax=Phialemonium atrogriseum TaxID=1093897 RepID=A0AAJ0FJU5_9PEZI|nr:FAD/NAD(P)-binding domain-containing protein [Phialemonium atrogriseum]KAK1770322.1 FAD/NAD(P)-binding domain-containing protein [Phialemonium atrogriseum]
MGSQKSGPFNVKNIAVIGAGPCGLSAARYLLAQNAFERIVIYEQQPEVGGVWNYSKTPSQTLHVPQVSAFCPPDPPIRSGTAPPVFPTPMYDVLHTNIPWPLMKYSDMAFPDDSLIFPSRDIVQDYLVKYAEDVRHLIKFSMVVKDVRPRKEDGRDQWDLDAMSTVNGDMQTATYDAVVVASGHYSTMFIPDVKNIREFHEAHPEVISHSKSYRTADQFANKKVVVVGNSASGLDIAAQISRVCRKPLLLSVKTPCPPDNLAFVGAEEVPVIEEFLVGQRGVRFQDGRVERDIDAILYSTGYLFTFPFLTSLAPSLVSDGRRVHGLYQHLIHIDHPTLVFPGLPIKVVPFPLSESQAAVFARVWTNAISLPSTAEMKEWEDEEARRKGPAFHVWPKGADGEYINSTHDRIVHSGTQGKEPPRWDDELLWQRKIYAEAKLKFEKEGRVAKSLDELGFPYPSSGQGETKEEIL